MLFPTFLKLVLENCKSMNPPTLQHWQKKKNKQLSYCLNMEKILATGNNELIQSEAIWEETVQAVKTRN